MNYIIPLEDFLFESKRKAKENFLDKELISEETFNEFLDIDTTPTKKFIETMCKFYSQGADKEDVISIFQQAIPMFIRNIIKVDIKSIKTLDELKGLVEEKQDYKTRSEIREEARDGAKLVYEDDVQKVYLIETMEASIIYGKGTEWCISANEHNEFDVYHKRGNLTIYFILSKIRHYTDPLYKVAVLVPSDVPIGFGTVWDSNDNKQDYRTTISELDLYVDIFKFVDVIYTIEDLYLFTKSWTLNGNGYVDVDGDIDISGMGLTKIPFKFGRVMGSFNCSNNKLTTLKNCPTYVGGSFYCYNNHLTSLEFAPTYVGRYFDITYQKNRHKFTEDDVRLVCQVAVDVSV